MKKMLLYITLLLLLIVALTGCVAPDQTNNQSTSTQPDTTQDPTQSPTDTNETTTENTTNTEDINDDINATTVTVTTVTDGDTIDIRYPNHTTDTVRLLGVDTPEVHTENTPDEFEGVPNNQAGRDCLRSYGYMASDYAKQTLLGDEVQLVFDAESDRRGYYGRLIAYIYHNNQNFNHNLILNGYARVYDGTFTQSDTFYSTEQSAMNNNRNLWSCRDIESTSTESSTMDETGDLDCNDFDTQREAQQYSRVIKIRRAGDGEINNIAYYLSEYIAKSFKHDDLLDAPEHVHKVNTVLAATNCNRLQFSDSDGVRS